MLILLQQAQEESLLLCHLDLEILRIKKYIFSFYLIVLTRDIKLNMKATSIILRRARKRFKASMLLNSLYFN